MPKSILVKVDKSIVENNKIFENKSELKQGSSKNIKRGQPVKRVLVTKLAHPTKKNLK